MSKKNYLNTAPSVLLMVSLTLFFTIGCNQSKESCPDLSNIRGSGPIAVPPGYSTISTPSRPAPLPPTTATGTVVIPDPSEDDITKLTQCTQLADYVAVDPYKRVPPNLYNVDNCFNNVLPRLNPRLSRQAGRVMNSLLASKNQCGLDYANQGSNGVSCL